MAAHLTEQDYQTVLQNLDDAKGKPQPQKHAVQARGRVRIPGTMNKTEERYAAHLESLKRIGAVLWYKFEGITFKLAADTRYTPDFAVMLPDGTFEAHEVKGRKKDGKGGFKAYSFEDSLIKIKVAAEEFPVQFVRTFEMPDGSWTREEF